MTAKGSIIFKILIVVFILALWQVISIPGKIWSEEDHLREKSQNNMISLYESELYHYSKTKKFVPSDSLENLLSFIQSDSALNERKKIGQLTNVLLDSINRILTVPTIKAIIPISQSLREINGDLEFNTRYFEKYEDILSQKVSISNNLKSFSASNVFPSFINLRNYVDSLSTLRDRLNEDRLQNNAQFAQRYIDSIMTYVPEIEFEAVQSYWSTQYTEINNLVKSIKNTDLVQVSSVADRLKRFIDRINSSMSDLAVINRQSDVRELQQYKSGVEQVYNTFLEGNNFLSTQNSGILQLNETDSILVKINEKNFYDPDTIDGDQRYLIAFKKDGTSDLVVESPNLLDEFQKKLQDITRPFNNLAFFPHVDQIRTSLDSTARVMDDAKTEYRLSRYSTDLLLGIKEVSAEMKDLDNIKLYRYVNNFKNFVETAQSEKRLSILKPMIQDILNPMDTLAARIKTRNVSDLKARLDYFDGKIKQLDSMVVNNNKIPARTKRSVPSFSAAYQNVYVVLDQMKNAFNASDADQMLQATGSIETTLLETLNGYNEKVYYVFSKEHKNHGFIRNGSKSWEEVE